MLDRTAPVPDLTPAEFRKAVSDFARTIGKYAEISTHCYSLGWLHSSKEPALEASVYPAGISKNRAFGVNAETFRDLLAAIEAKWASYRDQHRVELIRRMALKIIEITAVQGVCSDAALRADVFSAEDVAAYGGEACAEADRMAAGGPFMIITVPGANAPAAEAAE